jgi:ribosomal-protein-alanine N-acetyltransferase
VMIEDAKVVGFCILQPVLDEANLLLMAIDPQFHGQGRGMVLLEESIELLGESCVMIFLEVRASNRPAISLYEKVGFHQMGVRKNYYPADRVRFASGKEDAVLMALTRGNPFI